MGGSAGEAGTAGQGGDDGGDSMGEGRPMGGSAGQLQQPECVVAADCPQATSACVSVFCADGACGEVPVGEHSACPGGMCDAAGHCVLSSCGSKQRDGDETGIDCGGSCARCANGEGCVGGADCKSGVCTNQKCSPSGCTDGIKNGSETDIDCGGTCSSKCALDRGCAVVTDCAIAAGDKAESVRCLQQTCTSTKPPQNGIRYYQDFDPARLIEDATQCNASDDVCVRGVGSAYPMHGLNASGAAKLLTKTLLYTTAGAVGSGGKFDGTYCLTRIGTSLSFNDANAFTAMAWVKSTRSSSPWESAVVGALGHYFIAVDANPAAQRFLAALATTQTTAFGYTSATAPGQVPSGEWHHLAQTYDTTAGSVSLYLDGVSVLSRKQLGTLAADAEDLLIGCRRDSKLGQFFIGTLDEVVLYPRALTAAELSDYARRSKPQ